MSQKVSIIVPTYNSEKTIQQCIQSILEQSYQNIEIICVDDGSTDSTNRIIKKMASLNDKIKIIHNKTNKGSLYSRTIGVNESTGLYISFVDSDDHISKNYIGKLVENIKNGYDLCVSQCICSNNKNYNTMSHINNDENILNQFIQTEGCDYTWFVMWGKLCKKELIIKILKKIEKYYNIKMCEDIIFSLNLYKKIKRVKYCADSIYYYTHISDSITQSDSVNNYKKYVSDVVVMLNYLNSFKTDKNKYNIKGWKNRYYRIWFYKIYNSRMNKIDKIILLFNLFFIRV